MRGPDDREVATVQGCDFPDPQPFCSDHDGCVDRPEWQVAVDPHKLGDSQPVARLYRLDGERPTREIPQKAHLRLGAQSRRYRVDDLSDHQMWDDQRPGMRFEQFQARRVVAIVGVDVGVERASVDQERY